MKTNEFGDKVSDLEIKKITNKIVKLTDEQIDSL